MNHNLGIICKMFEDGFSFADIAKEVGKTEKQVKVIIKYTYC